MKSRSSQTRSKNEAAAWFAATRAGLMSVERRAELDAWLTDPQNQAAFNAIQLLWDDLAILREIATSED